MGNLRGILTGLWAGKHKDIRRMSLEELVESSAKLLDAGEANQARTLSLMAIQINSDCADAWANLAFAEIQLGDLDSAQEAAEKAISIDPTHAVAWHNLGEVSVRKGLPEKSLDCNNRALTLDGERAVFWLGKGTAFAALERYVEAIACFDKALSIDPQMAPAKINREVSLLMSNSQRRDLLYTAVGLATRYEEKDISDQILNERLIKLFVPDPAFDSELIRSFDYFAQANIMMGKPSIVYFCQVNLTLALLLKDPELPVLCLQRLSEAESSLGMRR